jgi:oligopeptidase A
MSKDPIDFDFRKPDFSNFVTTLTTLIEQQRAEIAKLTQATSYSWDSLIEPLEDMDNKMDALFTPLSHLNSVCNSEKTRDVYNACIPLLTEFSTECGQNLDLCRATESMDTDQLNTAQKKSIEHSLRAFKLSGVTLSDHKKKEFQALCTELSLLTTKFEENILDSTQAWSKHITDVSELSGLPDYALETAQQVAQQSHIEGYVLTLHAPCYIAVMQYADNRDLRQEMHLAYCTRASDQGPHDAKFDNAKVMAGILEKRLQIAQLLGYSDYAEYSLATKMVKEPQKVLDFLWGLVEKSRAQAKNEYQELQEFAQSECQLTNLEAWDLSYISEKLKQQHYAISDQELRPYFPVDKVRGGLFKIVERLFNVKISEQPLTNPWHPDVKCFKIENDSNVISYCYMDLYARDGKRNGAWMTDAQNRYKTDTIDQLPIAFVTCNFNPASATKPALLSHDDVICLFHEFGHALQHMLTEVPYLSVSGISGVPWDAVEVCSQFLENWAWQKECMPLISGHYETQEPLPDEMLERMQKARHFQSAMQMLRQLEFSLFDFILHQDFDLAVHDQVQQVLDDIRQQVSVVPVPEYNRFQNGFSHIFAGGYAAGYYSYKWAEVMAADAFSLFLEKGLFDQDTSEAFRQTFLASGGAIEPIDLFIEFRGREPKIDALLEDCGIR